MMYEFGNQGWGAGGWIFMAVAMVIFWAIVVFGVIALVRYVGHNYRNDPSIPKDPESILKERFAKGEIDEESFRKSIATLKEH
ncbi:MAG: SHOCT domain-containing protein [Acidimicrobiaceae bacterium]|nr:SHOCT domain-containing protein [Acidimicrobiaceae bacterium]